MTKPFINFLTFSLSITILTLAVIFKYYSAMDLYELFFLITGVGIVIFASKNWQAIQPLVSSIILASSLAIWAYNGSLMNAQNVFLLKYFLASQSAVMWMNVLFISAMLVYWLSLWRVKWGQTATRITWTAVAMGFIGLMVRWYESYLIAPDVGHIPISNLYEVFILFCLITAFIYLYFEEKLQTKQLGGFVLLVINAGVGFILWYIFDRHAHEIQPLVPALQSYWMKIHVPANFIGYGSFSFSAMVAIAYLLKAKGILTNRLPSLEVLDDLMYRAISVGFIFFTIATILGAMWAAEAWGSYWSWDPKETWALIVWLNYAAWLHLRMMNRLQSSILAWWAVLGLFVTAFAFLGVNMYLSGLHSYGEL